MPYQKTGFFKKPKSQYLPQIADEILTSLGGTFDLDISEMIKSLGHERTELRNMWFDRLLRLNHPKLTEDLRRKMLILLADFLHQCGYIDTDVAIVGYRVDPVIPMPDLIDLMLSARMPKFESSMISGERATIDILQSFFPEVIRRYALVLNERNLMAQRLRQWLGNIGWKLRTLGSSSLSQTERSFLVVYGCTKKRTAGHYPELPSTAIPPIENKEPLVTEVGAMATSVALSGPCTNHMKMVSNTIFEQLLFYYGPHVAELKTHVGYVKEYGPFSAYLTTPEDAIPWMLEAQITGLSATASNIGVRPSKRPPFTLRMPMALFAHDTERKSGTMCLYPDIPEFNLWLTNEKDISLFDWDYPSRWQGRRIHSTTDGGMIEYALCDIAITQKQAGNTQAEMTDLTGIGISWLEPEAAKRVVAYDGNISEEYILPSPSGLVRTRINMTAYYARYGSTELLPAFAEYIQLPLSWFVTPVAPIVDYVCTLQGLTQQERIRFELIISASHNCARYKRVTGKDSPLDVMEYAELLLNL